MMDFFDRIDSCPSSVKIHSMASASADRLQLEPLILSIILF